MGIAWRNRQKPKKQRRAERKVSCGATKMIKTNLPRNRSCISLNNVVTVVARRIYVQGKDETFDNLLHC